MKISMYFELKEVEHSNIAREKGIDNTLTPAAMENARYAAARLDLLRNLIGLPIIPTSWYRASVLNRMVGGTDSSQHLRGLAIDFTTKGNLGNVFNQIINLKKQGKIHFDQCYYRPARNFIHISFCRCLEDERGMSWVKEEN